MFVRVALLLLLFAATPSDAESGCYTGPSPGALRVNAGQVLGTHNSYHSFHQMPWNYSFPPLTEQLEVGVRAFELDLWFDFQSLAFRVLHVPHADERSNCRTLDGCLDGIQTWQSTHPGHFPLFFQLELMGGLKANSSVPPKEASKCYYT